MKASQVYTIPYIFRDNLLPELHEALPPAAAIPSCVCSVQSYPAPLKHASLRNIVTGATGAQSITCAEALVRMEGYLGCKVVFFSGKPGQLEFLARNTG
eukprot:1139943-Pelagomonas_calceolata.AAC.1